ncbi:zeta toxin family protein [Burkholderia gladioli]|uniref:zeta toxin family protein n=1 Tax=Burkholderia gladioli TaxID=28095 RepID=UPI001C233221|nr:zeta toxin family protein [Burkholderia gladioli]MBU9193025.1 zeta toxin family protein [Burkholderia gladioli]
MDTIPDLVMQRAYARVEREALEASREQVAPTAILLGGQPGAGKTALARRAVAELGARGGAVLIDADRTRENLPQYSQLLRENPQHAADLTHVEAGRWSGRLTHAASEARRNLVIDGTMRNPESLHNLARRLNERGYTLEVRGVAMPGDVSLARAQMRTEREIATTGVGRVVNPQQHDQAYAGMVETVALLEREKAVNRIRIVDRHHREIYRNELHQGDWREPPAAADAIARERGRPMTHEEIADHAAMLGDILALRTARGAPAPDIADVALRREYAVVARQAIAQTAPSRAPAAIEPSSDRSLREVLRSMTRNVPNLGGHYPDPVAQDIANSPHFAALEARLRALGMSRLTPLDAGASSVVLAADDKHVVRIGAGALVQRPKIPEVLQPVASGEAGSLRYEVMPRADTRGITPADADRMAAALERQGYHWGDKGADNLGVINGRVVVLDPGGIEPMREERRHELSRQAEPAKAEKAPEQDGGVDAVRAPRRRTVNHARDAERGRAFDTLGRDQALALFPELDAAYHRLETQTELATVPSAEIQRANLSEQIHRGQLPEGDVPDDVSRRAIGLAGDRHNLILRDAQELERHYRGEVLANSSHHSLVKIGQTVGIVYPRERLSRDIEVGEQVAIRYSPDSALHQVKDHEQHLEQAERVQDHQHSLER